MCARTLGLGLGLFKVMNEVEEVSRESRDVRVRVGGRVHRPDKRWTVRRCTMEMLTRSHPSGNRFDQIRADPWGRVGVRVIRNDECG